MACKTGLPIEWVLESWSASSWIRDVFWPYWASWKLEEERGLLPLEEEEAALLQEQRSYRRQLRALPRLGVMQRNKRRYTAQDMETVRAQRDQLQQQYRAITAKIRDETAGSHHDAPPRREHHDPIHGGCPRPGCNGFIRGSSYVCRLCNARACPECGDLLVDNADDHDNKNHTCNKDRRASMAAIREETRPCPRCRAPIFRTGGCDQMWCTQCRTPFSWATGRVLDEHTETVHNPHYYEWVHSIASSSDALRGMETATLVLGQEDGRDLPCAMMYSFFLQQHPHLPYRRFLYLHRLTLHLERVVLPTLVETTRIRDNKDLRLQFLLGDIDTNIWRQRLIYREKRRLKLRALHHMVRSSLVLFRDMIRLSILRPEDPPTLEDMDRVHNLTKHRTEQILRFYGGTLPYVIPPL
jgi:hypothetical protein